MGNENSQKDKGNAKADFRSWAVVSGLALAFLLYGLFMFMVVGDKGPPEWDFSTVEDIPGKSEYSTFPQPGGTPVEPDPQHVSGRPPLAPGGYRKAGSGE